MESRKDISFAELLDELISSSREEEPFRAEGPRPSLRLDMLAQIERLQAENSSLFREKGASAYREMMSEPTPPIAAGLDETEAKLQPALEDLFFLDPQSIANELGIKTRNNPADLDKARRSFAKRYHPDRVPEHMRDRAAMRMQIANMLIDEAKRAKR
ncbi:hypothetical protein [Aquamicrobium sp. LC103]|uniref:hypothetical protein n=1 Tax=Aquamicrobium sp. LC103 TaxID=1120658 RepID=UPI00069BCC1E|nr:hypothetical protein [Aquamicrobium sp. LC103]TKT76927.1 hypothetical protein XW59_015840 [Aquamicrobium sp. LC103]